MRLYVSKPRFICIQTTVYKRCIPLFSKVPGGYKTLQNIYKELKKQTTVENPVENLFFRFFVNFFSFLTSLRRID